MTLMNFRANKLILFLFLFFVIPNLALSKPTDEILKDAETHIKVYQNKEALKILKNIDNLNDRQFTRIYKN